VIAQNPPCPARRFSNAMWLPKKASVIEAKGLCWVLMAPEVKGAIQLTVQGKFLITNSFRLCKFPIFFQL
jgi:hypothetical protein